MTDMNQLIEMQQALTFFGSIGGLALALLGAGLAAIDSADTINPAMSPALVAKLVKEYVL